MANTYVETTLSGVTISPDAAGGGHTLDSAPILSGTFVEEFNSSGTLLAVTEIDLFVTLDGSVTTFAGSTTIDSSTGTYIFHELNASSGGGSNPASYLEIGTASEMPTSVSASIEFGSYHYFSTGAGTVSSAVVCFVAGTRIRTPEGEAAAESLQPGDLVLTAAGAARPVRWLGRSEMAGRFADAMTAAPICIKAGALGDGLPLRDLRVSPAHALYLDGILVQAGALVNGSSIIREPMPEHFTYYHIELDTHELVIAEGAATESFVDNVERTHFTNAHERAGRVQPILEMDLPRAKSHRQVPESLRQRLLANARLCRAGESQAA